MMGREKGGSAFVLCFVHVLNFTEGVHCPFPLTGGVFLPSERESGAILQKEMKK